MQCQNNKQNIAITFDP